MRRVEFVHGWNGWRRIEALLGLCLILFGVLVALFPKLLVFIFAALCITAGLSLMFAARRDRLSERAFTDRSGFDVYSIW
jgi:uncharacterized membrane protein